MGFGNIGRKANVINTELLKRIALTVAETQFIRAGGEPCYGETRRLPRYRRAPIGQCSFIEHKVIGDARADVEWRGAIEEDIDPRALS